VHMANYKTYKQIQSEVAKMIKDPNEQFIELIKPVINHVYLTEILQADVLYPLHWLMRYLRLPIRQRATITNITQASPAVITVDTANVLQVGQIVGIWGVSGMTEINCDYKGYADDLSFDGLYLIGTTPTDVTATLTTLDDANVDTTAYTAYTSGGTLYQHGWKLPLTPIHVQKVGIHDSLPLDPLSWDEFLDSPDSFLLDGGSTPAYWIHRPQLTTAGGAQDLIFTFPGSTDDHTIYIYSDWQPNRLDADADVPLIPFQFHDALVSGSISRLGESNVQVEAPAVWPGVYQAQLSAMVDHNRTWWAKQEELKRKAVHF